MGVVINRAVEIIDAKDAVLIGVERYRQSMFAERSFEKLGVRVAGFVLGKETAENRCRRVVDIEQGRADATSFFKPMVR